MSEKAIKKLRKEIEVKDALIARLINIISENNVKIQDETILKALLILYPQPKDETDDSNEERTKDNSNRTINK